MILQIINSLVTEGLAASSAMSDRIGNSGRNSNRVAMIRPEPEPDCHPKKGPDVTGLAGSCRIFPKK